VSTLFDATGRYDTFALAEQFVLGYLNHPDYIYRIAFPDFNVVIFADYDCIIRVAGRGCKFSHIRHKTAAIQQNNSRKKN